MVLTRTLMKVAPIAIGGLLAILYFRRAFEKGAGQAGFEIGSSFKDLGTGLGTGLGGVGSGLSGLGTGIGTGISGLFKPLWELKNLASSFGMSSSQNRVSESRAVWNRPEARAAAQSSSQQRVSSAPRTRTQGSSWTVATHATSGGRAR